MIETVIKDSIAILRNAQLLLDLQIELLVI